MKTRSAFTLIELLVVIAVIGLLATLAVVALNNARQKARDAKRVADIKQIQTALELYFNDMSHYPLTAEFGVNGLYTTSTNGTTTYLAVIPVAPVPSDGTCSNTNNAYYYSSTNGSTYTLSFCIGGRTGSIFAGLNTASPMGIAYGGPGAGSATGCDCDNAALPCCNHCNTSAVCQGGTYCGSTANCPLGQFCNSGTCSSWACGSPITVTSTAGHVCNTGAPDYDTCSYDTVQVGSQCWLKQNMNVGNFITSATAQTNNSTLEKYCYNNGTGACPSFGGLYFWDEAMQYSTLAGAQGICPSGWHLPTDGEWFTLENYLKDSGQTCGATRAGWECDTAGTKLKSGGSSGFEALLSGYFQLGSFLNQGVRTYFWSSLYTGPDGWNRVLASGNSTIGRGYNDRSYGFSVRCIQN